MSHQKTEKIITSMIAGLAGPLTLFFLFWWGAGALASYRICPLPERWIASMALSGLAIGLIIDILFLRKFLPRFYSISNNILIPLYLLWSVIAVALCMGLPLGNIFWGISAGFYIGRKKRHLDVPRESLSQSARRTGLFTAVVTGLEMLPIGILGLREDVVQRIFQSALGLAPAHTTGLSGMSLVIVFCLGLMGLQFWLTWMATLRSFGKSQGSLSS